MDVEGMTFAQRLFIAEVGSPFFLVGLALWAWARWRRASARRWVPATGRIASASFERFEGDSTITYEPTVIYRYVVGARAFEARRIRLLGTSKSPSRPYAEALIARYAPDTTVTVFHDPHNPFDACLEIDEPTVVPFVVMAGSLPFWIAALVWP